MAKVQSVEPNIADLANGWLKSYKLPYKLEQESLNNDGKTGVIYNWPSHPSRNSEDWVYGQYR